MVILYKVIRQPKRLKLILPKRLHEEAATILKNVRDKHNNIPQVS